MQDGFIKINFLKSVFIFVYRYVQHRITEYSEFLKKQLIDGNGIFLLAGNSKNMPKAVREALAEALDSPKYVDDMIKQLRYQEETWA